MMPLVLSTRFLNGRSRTVISHTRRFTAGLLEKCMPSRAAHKASACSARPVRLSSMSPSTVVWVYSPRTGFWLRGSGRVWMAANAASGNVLSANEPYGPPALWAGGSATVSPRAVKAACSSKQRLCRPTDTS